MFKLIRRNLLRNKRRTVLTVLSIAIALVLLSSLQMMLAAMSGADAAAANRLVVRHAISLTFSLPAAYEQRLATLEHVEGITPVNWFQGRYIDDRPENFFPRFGTNPDTFFDVYPELEIDPGQAETWRAERSALYVVTALGIAATGGIAAWLSHGLPDGAGIWLAWNAPTALVLTAAAIMTGTGIAVAYAFKRLSTVRGWRENDVVRAIMPETKPEKSLFCVLTVAAGAGEEVVFRGFLSAFLMPWFGSYLLAALPVSVTFGCLHNYQGRHGMVRTGMLGMLLAGGVAWTGSLWPSIVAHIALNLAFGLALRGSLLEE